MLEDKLIKRALDFAHIIVRHGIREVNEWIQWRRMGDG